MEEHPASTPSIEPTDFEIVTEVSSVHPAKRFLPSVSEPVSSVGNVKDVKAVEVKAPAPMFAVREYAAPSLSYVVNVTVFNDLQSTNALSPMDVTVEGMMIEVSTLQFLNMEALIRVVPSGSVMLGRA